MAPAYSKKYIQSQNTQLQLNQIYINCYHSSHVVWDTQDICTSLGHPVYLHKFGTSSIFAKVWDTQYICTSLGHPVYLHTFFALIILLVAKWNTIFDPYRKLFSIFNESRKFLRKWGRKYIEILVHSKFSSLLKRECLSLYLNSLLTLQDFNVGSSSFHAVGKEE